MLYIVYYIVLNFFFDSSLNDSLNRGSYMSVNVLMNLLNELGKSDKMQALLSIL